MTTQTKQTDLFKFKDEADLINRIKTVKNFHKAAGFLNSFDKIELMEILKNDRYGVIFLQQFKPYLEDRYFYKKCNIDDEKINIVKILIRKHYF